MQDYEVKKVNEFRERKKYSFFPFIIAADGDIIWTGKWFRYVTIREQKIMERFNELNQSSYNYVWSDWEENWVFVKII